MHMCTCMHVRYSSLVWMKISTGCFSNGNRQPSLPTVTGSMIISEIKRVCEERLLSSTILKQYMWKSCIGSDIFELSVFEQKFSCLF